MVRSPGSSRPNILNDEESRTVVAMAVVDPFITPKLIRNTLELRVCK